MSEAIFPIYQARVVFQVDNVYEGKSVFIDWKSGLEPAIYARFNHILLKPNQTKCSKSF